MRRKIYKIKEQKQQMQGLHIQFIPCGPIKVLKYVVMCSGLVRFSHVEWWLCMVEARASFMFSSHDNRSAGMRTGSMGRNGMTRKLHSIGTRWAFFGDMAAWTWSWRRDRSWKHRFQRNNPYLHPLFFLSIKNPTSTVEENDCCDSLNNFEKSHDDLGWVKQTGDNKIDQYFYVSNMKIYGGERSPVIYEYCHWHD